MDDPGGRVTYPKQIRDGRATYRLWHTLRCTLRFYLCCCYFIIRSIICLPVFYSILLSDRRTAHFHTDVLIHTRSIRIGSVIRLFQPAVAKVTHHQFNWWFGVGPKKGHITAAPKKAVSQALLLASAKKRIPYYLLSSTLPTALLYIF